MVVRRVPGQIKTVAEFDIWPSLIRLEELLSKLKGSWVVGRSGWIDNAKSGIRQR